LVAIYHSPPEEIAEVKANAKLNVHCCDGYTTTTAYYKGVFCILGMAEGEGLKIGDYDAE